MPAAAADAPGLVRLVLNPRAGAGRAGRRIDDLRRAADRALPAWDLVLTEGPGHASALAAAAAADPRVATVAAVGGDGTCHEVVNGMVAGGHARRAGLCFATVPFGTGSDLQKTLEIPAELDAALRVAGSGTALPTDLIAVELAGPRGPVAECFVNVAGFGANGEVVRRANQMDKRLGGTVTFLRASIEAAFAYRPAPLHLAWEGPAGPQTWEGTVLSVFVANGRRCGGGMDVAPAGSMHDGWADVTILPDTPTARQLWEARRLYDGSLAAWPGARTFRARQLIATPRGDAPVYLDLDGENPGALPARFSVLPQVIPMRGAWRSMPRLAEAAPGDRSASQKN